MAQETSTIVRSRAGRAAVQAAGRPGASIPAAPLSSAPRAPASHGVLAQPAAPFPTAPSVAAPHPRRARALPAWVDIWVAAITRPQIATFEKLAASPSASTRQAYTWLGAAAVAGWAIPALVSLARGGLPAWVIMLALVALAGLTLAWFSLAHGAADYLAQIFGTRLPFDRIAYAAASFCAPLVIIAGVLMAGPGFMRALLVPLLGYAFYLDVLAVRAVYRLGWVHGLVAAAPGTLLMLVPLAAVAAVAVQLL
jgi:hypothetical protein